MSNRSLFLLLNTALGFRITAGCSDFFICCSSHSAPRRIITASCKS